jgi:hypothetical protein
MEPNDEITPLTPSEMGKRGAAARWSQGKRRNIGKPPKAYPHRAVEKLTREIHQSMQSRSSPGAIPECLIREWMELFERAKAAGNRARAIKVRQSSQERCLAIRESRCRTRFFCLS